MAVYTKIFSNNSQYQLRLTVNQKSQSVSNNRSVVSWSLVARKLTGTGYEGRDPTNWSVNIGGVEKKGTVKSYNFANYTNLTLGSGDVTINHNNDGKKSISSSGTWKAMSSIGSATASGSLTLTTIPRNPSTPSLSLRSRTETSIAINWSGTSLSVDRIEYRLNGGSWVSVNSSGTSGNFNITGLANGRSYEIGVRARSSASSLYSGVRNTTQRTLHVSTLSSYSLVPTNGYNNRLTLAVKGTQTGGSTTIQYKLSSSSTWNNTTGGSISGLSNNTSYTVNLRAVNSDGPTRTYNVSARTHASPTGSFSLSQQNKTQITITHSSANATHADYSFNGGAWTNYSSGRTLTGLTPGTAYTVRVRLRSTSTGLTTDLGTKSITMTANVIPTASLSNIVRYRAHVTISASGANAAQYRYRLSGGSWSGWEASTLNGANRIPSSGSFTSSTVYNIETRVRDSASGQWGAARAINLTTASFKTPSITIRDTKLTSIGYTITPSDSCKLTKVTAAGSTTNIGAWSGFQTAAASPTLTTVEGANLYADRDYVLTFEFEDQYGKSGVRHNVNVSRRTLPLDSTNLLIGRSNQGTEKITSLTNPEMFPKFDFRSSGVNYTKKTSLNLGAYVYEINWTGSSSYTISVENLKRILQTEKTKKYYDISYVTKYTEAGRESRSTQSGSFRIEFDNSLLTQPKINSITYNGSDGVELNRFYSRKINDVNFNYGAISGVEGSTIKTSYISFNGTTYPINGTAAGSIKSVKEENISSSTATIYIEDTRGLVSTSTFPVSITNYNYPTISLRAFGRQDGFTDILELRDLSLSFTSTSSDLNKDTKIDNTITRVSVERAQGNSGTFTELKIGSSGNLMSHMGININETNRKNGTYHKEISLVGEGQEWFPVESAFKIQIKAIDKFYPITGYVATLTGIVIATGKGLIFFDELNRQVGVNTTVPRGRFEVDGDAYFSDIYSLNGLFFKPEDFEDI